MRIVQLHLEDFCGFKSADIEFGDFTCLYGPNGIGKTTILNAISMLCSSMDYGEQRRLVAQLRKNIRNVDEEGDALRFLVQARFNHLGHDLEAVLTEKGFEKNDVVKQPGWWTGLAYFAKFDVDTNIFSIPMDVWDKFAAAYEGITGIKVEPDVYEVGFDKRYEKELAAAAPTEVGNLYSTGFYMHKENGRIHSRKASSGERKIAKALAQIVALEPSRKPHIVLVDEIEKFIHFKRHLKVVEEMKKLFSGTQIVSTTHSTVIMEQYEPKTDLRDIEAIWKKGYADARETAPSGIEAEG